MDTKKHMGLWGVGLALLLLGWQAQPVVGESENLQISTGVVATITAIDANTDVATLQTEAGEVFELPQRSQWHVGHKVLCDRIEGGRHSRLRDCRLWEEVHSGVQSPAPRAGRFADTEPPRATPKGLFSPND